MKLSNIYNYIARLVHKHHITNQIPGIDFSRATFFAAGEKKCCAPFCRLSPANRRAVVREGRGATARRREAKCFFFKHLLSKSPYVVEKKRPLFLFAVFEKHLLLFDVAGTNLTGAFRYSVFAVIFVQARFVFTVG